MKARTINSALLKQAIKARGEGGLASLAQKSRVSLSWLQKASTGNYSAAPRGLTREALCRATGYSEAELFPIVSPVGKKQAS